MCALQFAENLGLLRQETRRIDVMWVVRRAIAAVALLAGLITAAPAGAAGFATPLPIPPVLDQDEITIHAAKTLVPILPGAPTEMWTFNGTFPGPTIRRQAGDATKINFVNDLPADTGALTIHTTASTPRRPTTASPTTS